MRAVILLVVLVLGGLSFPREAEAAVCEDGLTTCMSSEILMSIPESWDLTRCVGEYLECVFRWIKAV